MSTRSSNFESSTMPHAGHEEPALRPWRLNRLPMVWGAGLAILAAGASVAGANDYDTGHDVSVTEKVDLATTPAQTWDRIQDFMKWPAWHPAFAGTQLLRGDGNSKGSVRLLTAKDGAQFTEELIAHDAAAHSYQYRILSSPAPVTGYVSTLEVREAPMGSSVVWSSTFRVKPGTSDDEARKAIAGIYRLGLDNLATAVK